LHFTGAGHIKKDSPLSTGQSLAQIDLNLEGGLPGLFGKDTALNVNLDFFRFNFFMICDRSDGERYSTAECADNQLDRAEICVAFRIAPLNRKRSVVHLNFRPPRYKLDV
jgi:hypothetical protein